MENQYLPWSDDVLDRIFTFLPIKQAIQIGTISSRFQKTWLSCRKLNFDEDFARDRPKEEFVRIVDGIISQLCGPKIQCFRLYFDPIDTENIVMNWIKWSADKGVEELDLDFSNPTINFINRTTNSPFRLPARLFDIHSLKILKLCMCQFYLPSNIKGLRFLSTLVLRKVIITSTLETLLETVFHNCMLFECLDITECFTYIQHLKIHAQGLKNFKTMRIGDCRGILRIAIDAPTLLSFYYRGHIPDFNFTRVSKLNDLLLDFDNITHINQRRVEKIAPLLSHVSVFSTSSTFLESLSSRNGNGRLRGNQLCLGQLKEFQLFMEIGKFCSFHDIVSFTSNCPCLEKLFIEQNISFDCELPEGDLLTLNCLRFIKIKSFEFKEHALKLAKYLLEKAVILESLVLIKKNSNEEVEARHSQLLESWKASSEAEIQIYYEFNDMSSVDAKHITRKWF